MVKPTIKKPKKTFKEALQETKGTPVNKTGKIKQTFPVAGVRGQMTKTANEILQENINMNHELVLIIGFNKNGKIHIDTNRPTYEFVNYAINRANYNINHLETTDVLQKEMQPSPPVTEAEIAVATQVAENTTKKTRGRPKKGS